MNIPKLRFPEFKGEWEEKKFSEIVYLENERDVCKKSDYITTENLNKDYAGVTFNTNSNENVPGIKYLKDDILFGNIRPYLKKVWQADRNGCVNSDVLVFKIIKDNSKFINNIICSDLFLSHVMNGAKGTKMPRGDKNQMMDFIAKIPSLPEQQKIADFLSNVDSIITAETKILNTLQKKKKALMQKLFTRQLRFKSADGTDFPAWEESTLEKECDYVDYRGKTPKKVSTGIFLVTAKNIKLGYIDYECSKEYIAENDYNEVMHRGKVKLGDVLITTEAPCGNVAQIDNENVALAQRVIKYSSKGRLNNTFLKYYFLSDLFRTIINEKATGSTVKGIKGSVLHKQKVIVPSLAEQQKIADCLSSLDSLIQIQQKVVTTWQQRKKALLQQMFV